MAKWIGPEYKFQEAAVQMIQLLNPSLVPVHVPNEGKRTKQQGAALVRQGLKSGVPDILIFERKGNYAGLAIELKVGYNKPTPNQKSFLEHLEKNGWLTAVCWGLDEVEKIIREYK